MLCCDSPQTHPRQRTRRTQNGTDAHTCRPAAAAAAAVAAAAVAAAAAAAVIAKNFPTTTPFPELFISTDSGDGGGNGVDSSIAAADASFTVNPLNSDGNSTISNNKTNCTM